MAEITVLYIAHGLTSLSLQISDEGVEEEEDEDRENDVEELLEKLKDVTELFDCKNEVYLEMEKKSEAMKIVKQTNKLINK